MRSPKLLIIFATLLALILPVQVLAAGGSILYLDAWGGYMADTTVTVQTTVQAADKKISGSNLYYTITGPGADATIRATHSTSLGELDPYHAYTDEWSTTNSGWPAGNYTITLCWSKGNSHNCDIAGPVTTTEYFVPTLDWGFGALGMVILGYWLWRRRGDFRPASRRAA